MSENSHHYEVCNWPRSAPLQALVFLKPHAKTTPLWGPKGKFIAD